MTKHSKDSVNYSTGMLHSHCGETFRDDKYFCKHFIPSSGYMGKCEKVAGEIEPIRWCELYSRAKSP